MKIDDTSSTFHCEKWNSLIAIKWFIENSNGTTCLCVTYLEE